MSKLTLAGLARVSLLKKGSGGLRPSAQVTLLAYVGRTAPYFCAGLTTTSIKLSGLAFGRPRPVCSPYSAVGR
jgi:hypothetical protein